MSTVPKLPLHPSHPERVCWGCPRYCPAAELACGNGSIRAPHPVELFGEDWLEFELEASQTSTEPRQDPADSPDVQPSASQVPAGPKPAATPDQAGHLPTTSGGRA